MLQEQEQQLQPAADIPVGGGHLPHRLLPAHVVVDGALGPAAVVRSPLPLRPLVSL